MKKRPQRVDIIVSHDNGKDIVSKPVEGTNTDNLISKITAAVRRELIQNVTESGLKIELDIGPADKDEFANPDR